MKKSSQLFKLLDKLPDSIEDLPAIPDTLVSFAECTKVKGKPFSLNNRPFMRALYQDDSKEIILVKGRQAGASLYLQHKILFNTLKKPGTKHVYATDRYMHAKQFSQDRMRPMIESSGIIKPHVDTKNMTYDRIPFHNGSILYVVSSYDDFDAARGIDADFTYVDEAQNCPLNEIATIRESMSASEYGQITYVGTGSPALTDWHKMWLGSTQGEWDDNTKQWIPADKKGRLPGYHIPQTLLPNIMAKDIEDKREEYRLHPGQFEREIMGVFSEGIGTGITSADIYRCFDPALYLQDGSDVDHTKGPVYIGIDWALSGGQAASTVIWIMQHINEKECKDNKANPIYRLLNVIKLDIGANRANELQETVSSIISSYDPVYGMQDNGGNPQGREYINDNHGEIIKKAHLARAKNPLNKDKLRSENLVVIDKAIWLQNTFSVMIPRDTITMIIPAAQPGRVDWITDHFTSMSAVSKSDDYITYALMAGRHNDAAMACLFALVAAEIKKKIYSTTRRSFLARASGEHWKISYLNPDNIPESEKFYRVYCQ